MKITAQTVNTKDVEVSVTSTMTIAYWEALLEQMPENPKHPLYQFISLIKDAVRKVKSVVETESSS